MKSFEFCPSCAGLIIATCNIDSSINCHIIVNMKETPQNKIGNVNINGIEEVDHNNNWNKYNDILSNEKMHTTENCTDYIECALPNSILSLSKIVPENVGNCCAANSLNIDGEINMKQNLAEEIKNENVSKLLQNDGKEISINSVEINADIYHINHDKVEVQVEVESGKTKNSVVASQILTEKRTDKINRSNGLESSSSSIQSRKTGKEKGKEKDKNNDKSNGKNNDRVSSPFLWKTSDSLLGLGRSVVRISTKATIKRKLKLIEKENSIKNRSNLVCNLVYNTTTSQSQSQGSSPYSTRTNSPKRPYSSSTSTLIEKEKEREREKERRRERGKENYLSSHSHSSTPASDSRSKVHSLNSTCSYSRSSTYDSDDALSTNENEIILSQENILSKENVLSHGIIQANETTFISDEALNRLCSPQSHPVLTVPSYVPSGSLSVLQHVQIEEKKVESEGIKVESVETKMLVVNDDIKLIKTQVSDVLEAEQDVEMEVDEDIEQEIIVEENILCKNQNVIEQIELESDIIRLENIYKENKLEVESGSNIDISAYKHDHNGMNKSVSTNSSTFKLHG